MPTTRNRTSKTIVTTHPKILRRPGRQGLLRFLALALLTLLPLLSARPAAAQVALAGKASTLGLGAELHAGLNANLNLRVGVNQYDYSDRREESGIDYDAEAKLRSSTLMLDWFPLAGGFHVTAGLLRNDTKVDGASVPDASGIYNIGGVPVPASQVGTLRARVDFDQQVPYAGLGWGNPIRSGSRFSIYFDAGVVFQGQPRVRLAADLPPGSPLNNPIARQALDILLQAEAREIEEDIEQYDKYPVIALGFAYRF